MPDCDGRASSRNHIHGTIVVVISYNFWHFSRPCHLKVRYGQYLLPCSCHLFVGQVRIFVLVVDIPLQKALEAC